MSEIDLNELVDEDCSIDLDTALWERVGEVQPDATAAGGAKRSKGGAAAVDAFIIQYIQKHRPSSNGDFASTRLVLPNPATLAVDSELWDNPAAWGCIGITVLYLACHMHPVLKHVWKKMRGKPPCPCCWDHEVQVTAEQQLTVEECYEQLSAPEIRQLQAAGKMGKVTCNGWLKSPFRKAGIAKPELLMAQQSVHMPGLSR